LFLLQLDVAGGQQWTWVHAPNSIGQRIKGDRNSIHCSSALHDKPSAKERVGRYGKGKGGREVKKGWGRGRPGFSLEEAVEFVPEGAPVSSRG